MDITELLAACAKTTASDLHLSPGRPPLYRLNGHLTPIESAALSAHELDHQLRALLTPAQAQSLDQQYDIDIALSHQGQRFRANFFFQQQGLAAAFRPIPDEVPTLSALQAPPVLTQLATQPHGLTLVTGPTGSGKSTTLAAMLQHMNQHLAYHLITIEDPIEFIHTPIRSLISQRELHQHTPSFSQALKAALREDPDVIMVGELRDLATIRLALTAAETGHAVLATLHTASAARSIHRLVDAFPGDEQPLIRNLLAESLRAVISQRLVADTQQSRCALHEIMIATPAIRNMVRDQHIAQIPTAIQTGSAQGMQSMQQSAEIAFQQGRINTDTLAKIQSE